MLLQMEKTAAYETSSEYSFQPLSSSLPYLHHSEYTSVSDVDVIRCGSLCGACNDYEVSKRITGQPQQMVITVSEKGIQGIFPIKF